MSTAPHTRIRIVQSRQNGRVKELRYALARPTASLIGLEGRHLVEEAMRSGLEVRTIFVRIGAESVLKTLAAEGGGGVAEALARVPEILAVPDDVLQSAVTTETPQAMAAIAVPPRFTLDQLFAYRAGEPLLLVLAGVQDPGNLGTIVRSAEAFGARGIMVLPGTASVWNAKSLRASMGSAFRLPVVAVSVEEALSRLSHHGVRSLAAVGPGHAALPAGEVDLASSCALWIGNEGAGLSPELVERIGGAVTIPCPGPVESLNAAVAASVLLYEAARQRWASDRPRLANDAAHGGLV